MEQNGSYIDKKEGQKELISGQSISLGALEALTENIEHGSFSYDADKRAPNAIAVKAAYSVQGAQTAGYLLILLVKMILP